MAKVHPSSSSPSPPDDASSKAKEVFTVWMKSLVLNGNGCTIYDSSGKIIYRVDNYDSKCRAEVYIMDVNGKVLLKILKKKLRLFGRWEGYKYENSTQEEEKPWFKVKKPFKVLKGSYSSCEALGANGFLSRYRLVELNNKSSYKIVDIHREIIAEVRRKATSSGVALSDDVLNLVVEGNMDISLVVGLVVVHGLMNHCM